MKGCRNCPAYAKCTVTYRGSACAALRGTYGIDSDPEIVTNADRIRAMSDEELAWELMTWRLDAVARNHGVEGVYPDTQKEILKWLHQPAKEDTQRRTHDGH